MLATVPDGFEEGNLRRRARPPEPTTMAFDGINQPVGGAAFLATMFDEELASLPGRGLILAAGDNVGA